MEEPTTAGDIKEEVAGKSKLQSGLSDLKSRLSHLCTKHTQLRNLRTKLQVKSRNDPLLQHRPEELGKAIEGLAGFISQVELTVAETEDALDTEPDAAKISAKITTIEAMAVTCDHRLGGAKEGLKRYTALLA